MIEPKFLDTTTNSGARLIRFDSPEDLFYYEDPKHNTQLLGGHYNGGNAKKYLRDRYAMTPKKQDIIIRAQQELKHDKEFLDLIYKAKSAKRSYTYKKAGGALSIPKYAIGDEKLFKRMTPGAKKQTLNMAFQVMEITQTHLLRS